MDFIRSALFALFFYAGTIVTVSAAILVAPLGSTPVIAVARSWAWYHRWCVRLLLRIRVRLEGAVPSGAVLVAAKHQSMFETIELMLMLNKPAVVLKRELAEVPAWGFVARRYGVIPVHRTGGAVALRKMLTAARAALAAGRGILIFPEGTRVAPGDQPPLQAGFAGLYRALNIEVVPIALDSGHLWPRRRFIKRPGTITFRIGETIPPGLPRHEIEARVHAGINALEAKPVAAE